MDTRPSSLPSAGFRVFFCNNGEVEALALQIFYELIDSIEVLNGRTRNMRRHHAGSYISANWCSLVDSESV